MVSMSKFQVASNMPGWADLPRDLLESVLGRLPVPDRLRFPAVCTAWQSAAPHRLEHDPIIPAPPCPWLMLPFNPTKLSSSEARFLSVTEEGRIRAYAIRHPLPAVSDRLCIGSSRDGWLVTADESSELHLLNPVSGAQVPLPSVTTLPYVDASRDAQGRVASYGLGYCCRGDDDPAPAGEEETIPIPPETFAADRLRFEMYEKAVVVSAPRSSSSWAVLLICQPLSRLAFARAGDAAWTLLDTPSRCWADAVVSSTGRVVYTMDTAGRVDAWNVTDAAATPSCSRSVAPACCCRCCTGMSASCRRYLVEVAPGQLLQVHRIREAAHARSAYWEPRPDRVEYITTKVQLFQWTAQQSRQWVQVDSSKGVLAGRALFLGKNASLCLPVDGCPGLRGDCVYFTDDGPWSHDRCHEVLPDVGVLDLADGTYRPPRGALRDLLWKWPPPVWVFPSLAN